MRFYTQTRKHYCGIDLHARTMYVCVLNQEGDVLLHRDLECDSKVFLAAIRPFRGDLVVGVECIFTWHCWRTCAPGKASPPSSATPSTCA
jgi:hypothetical protein